MNLQFKIDLLTNKLEYLIKEKEYCETITKEAMVEFHAEFMTLISHLSEKQKKLIYKFINARVGEPEEEPILEEGADGQESRTMQPAKKETPEPIKKVFKETSKRLQKGLSRRHQQGLQKYF